MKRIDFLIKFLKDKDISVKEITDIFYENCPEEVNVKRQYYINKNKPKTETELRTQISAELCSKIIDQYKIFFIANKTFKPQTYSLSEKGIEKYNELFGEEIEIIPTEEEINNIIKEDPTNNIGYVYLLKSKFHGHIYKIGITNRPIDQRLDELKKNSTYGSYGLYLISYVKIKNFGTVEQVLHKYFEDFRLCKKNDLGIDTELFLMVEMEKEFEFFIKSNYLTHPRLKKDVFEYYTN